MSFYSDKYSSLKEKEKEEVKEEEAKQKQKDNSIYDNMHKEKKNCWFTLRQLYD